MQRILFLYSRVNGFVISTLRELVRSGACSAIDMVYWADAKANGNLFLLNDLPGVTFHPRAGLDEDGLVALLNARRPTTVYISGWMDSGYLGAIRRYRASGGECVTVCGIDDQWHGRLRQRLGRIYFRLTYRKLFDFMWVSGKPQYHYARMFGYAHHQIISNLLSADTEVFQPARQAVQRFVFVGRFDPVKGLDTLVAAHKSLPEDVQAAWPLVLIGDGELRAMVERAQSAHIEIIPFLQPGALAHELAKGGVGVLPSTFESWGVSLHEMALMGYPLIASVQCGSASEFLVHEYNGLLFRSGDVGSLALAMRAMAELSQDERSGMSAASVELGRRITPRIVAYSLLSAQSLARDGDARGRRQNMIP